MGALAELDAAGTAALSQRILGTLRTWKPSQLLACLDREQLARLVPVVLAALDFYDPRGPQGNGAADPADPARIRRACPRPRPTSLRRRRGRRRSPPGCSAWRRRQGSTCGRWLTSWSNGWPRPGFPRWCTAKGSLAAVVRRDGPALARLVVEALGTVDAATLDEWGFQVWLGCLAGLSETAACAVLQPQADAQQVYACDVVYCDCATPIHDYLGNAHANEPRDHVEFDFDFAILDEVDFVLLDKGRRPVVLARTDDRYESDISLLLPLLGESSRFQENVHFRIAGNRVRLLDEGLREIETILQRTNLYDPDANRGVIPLVQRMLQARLFYKRQEDYIVADGEIVPLDELTYRPSGGAFLTNGTLQMLEYREGLRSADRPKARERQTLASIMPHNYFRMFRRLAGMSGTVKVEESRLAYFLPNEVYVLNRPRTRAETRHIVHGTLRESLAAVVDDVLDAGRHAVLVIAPTIELSREVYAELCQAVPSWRHVALLNAENYREEEQLTLRAGQPASVLVTTPMLGRGADIPLSPPARAAGGLLVLSVGRQRLRRLDQQVEGRCGRRGDPGQCVFHISFEDEPFKQFVARRCAVLSADAAGGQRRRKRPDRGGHYPVPSASGRE